MSCFLYCLKNGTTLEVRGLVLDSQASSLKSLTPNPNKFLVRQSVSKESKNIELTLKIQSGFDLSWGFSAQRKSDKAPTNKIYRRASSEQRPRTRSCHESERLV